jgi:hypothetical protein
MKGSLCSDVTHATTCSLHAHTYTHTHTHTHSLSLSLSLSLVYTQPHTHTHTHTHTLTLIYIRTNTIAPSTSTKHTHTHIMATPEKRTPCPAIPTQNRYQDAVREVIVSCHRDVQVMLQENRDALWAGEGCWAFGGRGVGDKRGNLCSWSQRRGLQERRGVLCAVSARGALVGMVVCVSWRVCVCVCVCACACVCERVCVETQRSSGGRP